MDLGVSALRRCGWSLLRVLWALGVLLLVYWLLLWPLQRYIVFPRSAHSAPEPPTVAVAGMERLWLETAAGRVEAWFIPGVGRSARSPGPAVIFAHGNAEVIDDWAMPLRPYVWRGVSVLIPEFRGYGRNPGKPSQAAITDDFVGFHDRLAARQDVDVRRIVFHGRSLGGGVACALAARRRPAALVLTSTFTSVPALAARLGAPRFLVRDPFDNLAFLRGHEGPVLLMHGRHDTVVPFRHAEALRAAARNARLVPVDSDHNDFPMESPLVWREIFALLSRAGVLEPASQPATSPAR